jgi:hypothetical protein
MKSIQRLSNTWLMKIKELQKSDYIYLIAILVLYTCASLFLFNRGLIFCADTVAYHNYYSSQPPLYPLIILICKLIAGSGYELLLLSIQISLGLIGITAFSFFLYKQFSLNKWIVLLFSIILFEPNFFGLQIGNNEATESLAYPLFLITVKYILEGVKQQSLGKFVSSFFFASLLIFTRAQFLFLYPLIAIIIFYLLLFTTMDKRQIMKLGIIFLAFILGNFLLVETYHYIRSGTFSRPTSGIQLAANAMYVSTLQDSTLFTNNVEKTIFTEIMTIAEKNHMTKSSSNNGSNSHYWNAYSYLVPLLKETFQQRYKPETVADSIASTKEYTYKYMKDNYLIAIEGKITKSISKKLLIHNWKQYTRLVLKTISYELGYPTGLIWKVTIGIGLIILFILGKRSYELTFLLIAVLCHVLNLGLVASVEHMLPRFSFYTDVLVFVLFMSVLFSFLEKKTLFTD